MRIAHCPRVSSEVVDVKGGALNIAAKPDLERIQRLFVTEIVSPLGTPETARAALLGNDLKPTSRAKVEIAVEIVD
jgi:hypothetical protein